MVRLLLRNLLRVHHLRLEHLGSHDAYESDKEEYDDLGYGSDSFCTCGTGLGGILCDVEFYVGVTLSRDDGSFGGGGNGG